MTLSKEINDKDPKFKVRDLARISKCKNNFAKGYTPNWSEEVYVMKEVKNTVLSDDNDGLIRYENSFNSWIDKKDLIE